MEEARRQSPSTGFVRRYPRRKLTTVVGILFKGAYSIVPCMEIGEGGLRFQCQADILTGGLVVANLFVPREHFIAVTGEIVYVIPNDDKTGPHSYGVKFKNLSFESKRQIRDYIAEKPANEPNV